MQSLCNNFRVNFAMDRRSTTDRKPNFLKAHQNLEEFNKESDDALRFRVHEFLTIVNSELREKGANLIVDGILFLSTWWRFGLIGRECTDI